jgi:hypothetical protein
MAIKDYDPVIRKRVRQLVDCLENLQDSVVDIAELFGFFSYVLSFHCMASIADESGRYDFMSDMAYVHVLFIIGR